jgi:hypothetical protein
MPVVPPCRPAVRCVLLLLALAAAIAAAPRPVLAWGAEGHRVVALLAETELTPSARAEVERLLAGEPEPTLAGVAAWADQIRDEPRWRHTARWHWVNLPRENPCTYVPSRDCARGDCIVGAIEKQLGILANRRKSDAARRDALKFVVHFIGDVHQPFHAGFGADRGGNDTQLRFDRQGWNLHALWDGPMVRHVGLSPPDYARQLRAAPALSEDRQRALSAPPKQWALESCQAIHDEGLYPERRAVGRGYLERHRPFAERRLREAGTRLAMALNEAL